MIDKIQVNFLGLSFPMNLHPGDDLLSNIIRSKGFYSVNDLIVMKELLRSGDGFLDIGANIGWHSIFAARWVGDSGLVHAFEPEPANFEILSENLRSNGNARPVCLALGDEEREVRLVGSARNMGDHSVDFEMKILAERARTARMSILDRYLAEVPIPRVRYLKIDAQGCEARILRGAAALIRRERPFIQAEFSPDHIRACGDSIFDVLAFIDKSDYRPFWIQEDVGLNYRQILKPVPVMELLAMAQRLGGNAVGIDLLLAPSERLTELASASRTS